MKASSLTLALVASLAAIPATATAQVGAPKADRRTESDFAPPIDVWLDQSSYDRGSRMRPYFSTEPGAYVTIVRVTSDGELRVMYPSRPRDQRPYDIGQLVDDRLPYAGDPAGNLFESSGSGFVFAIASYERFDYSYFTQSRQWNTARLATFGRYGDPFQVVRQFVDRILPQDADFSLDYEVYEVYSRSPRSVYGSRYAYSSISDYHDACLTAFGFRYNYYCRSYSGLSYGPIIVNNPRNPSPRRKVMTKPRDPSVYPNVPTIPVEPKPAEGRFPPSDNAERSARARYERTQKRTSPRSEQPFIYRSLPPRAAPSSSPRSEPRGETRPMTQSRPPSQPRVEGHFPQRSEPRAPARVEVRNEPRAEPRPVKPAQASPGTTGKQN